MALCSPPNTLLFPHTNHLTETLTIQSAVQPAQPWALPLTSFSQTNK